MTAFEIYENETYEGEQEAPLFEALDEAGFTGEVAELSETLESELAMELMEITSEEELDQFLGKLVRRVAKGAGALIKSPIGKALGGVLKSVAKTALPVVGSAIGSFVAPGVGTALGGKLGSMASSLLEAEEAETMGEEEANYEAARRYVRWASGTVRNVARAPRGAQPQKVLRSAAVSSARRYAPALLAGSARRTAPWRGRRGPGWGAPAWGAYPVPTWGAPSWDAGSAPDQPVPCTCGAQDADDYGFEVSDEGEAPAGVARMGATRTGRWVRRGTSVVVLGVGS